jgi:catechol 2,3-dioxygenase-like lactoylglutathione lyase family enzyme
LGGTPAGRRRVVIAEATPSPAAYNSGGMQLRRDQMLDTHEKEGATHSAEAGSGVDMETYRARTAERRSKNLVKRLHHHAYLAKDMEETRHFYEDILGFPLVGTWIERFNPVTNAEDNYMHTFFEMADGSCLAFFQFKDKRYNDKIALNDYHNNNPFSHHIALEVDGMDAINEMKRRLKDHNIEYVDTDHGFCYSIYFFDPNGMQVEFSTNVPKTDELFAEAGKTALETMRTWLAVEDMQTNNQARAKEGWVKGR